MVLQFRRSGRSPALPGWLLAGLIAIVAFCPALSARADKFPSRPLKLLVPAPAASLTDTVGRLLAERMAAALGQPVLIDNFNEADATIAAVRAAYAPADGHTLLLATAGPLAIAPAIQTDLGYDPARDFQAVALIGTTPQVLAVHPSLPVKTVHDLVVFAKANPVKLAFASAGHGTPAHLLGELLRRTAGIAIVHAPQPGAGMARAFVLAGGAHVYFDCPHDLAEDIAAGRLRALAVASEQRHRLLPQVPTMIESGFGRFLTTHWMAIVVPAGTPPRAVARLHQAIAAALNAAETQTALARLGVDGREGSPQEAAAFIAAEAQKWSMVVRAIGMRAFGQGGALSQYPEE